MARENGHGQLCVKLPNNASGRVSGRLGAAPSQLASDLFRVSFDTAVNDMHMESLFKVRLLDYLNLSNSSTTVYGCSFTALYGLPDKSLYTMSYNNKGSQH